MSDLARALAAVREALAVLRTRGHLVPGTNLRAVMGCIATRCTGSRIGAKTAISEADYAELRTAIAPTRICAP